MRAFEARLRETLPEPERSLLHIFDTVGSTNDAARELARAGAPHGTIVIAAGQTAGRGRIGRSFHSPAGAGLYMSLVWRPEAPPAALMPMTALCGLAVCDGLEALTGVRPRAKWPNDILYGGKKVCGILAEPALNSSGVEHVVLGVGINVLPSAFPPGLRDIAVSLAEAAGGEFGLAETAAAVVGTLRAVPGLLSDAAGLEAALARYAAGCVTVGKRVRVMREGEAREGVAEGINGRAALIVKFPDGSAEEVDSGEAIILQNV